MSEQQKLDALQHNDTFVAFLDSLKDQRESFIQAMHAAPVERLQQISGRILMLDEVLESAGYRQIEQRRRQKP